MYYGFVIKIVIDALFLFELQIDYKFTRKENSTKVHNFIENVSESSSIITSKILECIKNHKLVQLKVTEPKLKSKFTNKRESARKKRQNLSTYSQSQRDVNQKLNSNWAQA
jgi:hypothetical protein